MRVEYTRKNGEVLRSFQMTMIVSHCEEGPYKCLISDEDFTEGTDFVQLQLNPGKHFGESRG